MPRRLEFGPRFTPGQSFEQYVLECLGNIEKWSFDVVTIWDTPTTTVTDALFIETGEYLLKQNGLTLSLES